MCHCSRKRNRFVTPTSVGWALSDEEHRRLLNTGRLAFRFVKTERLQRRFRVNHSKTCNWQRIGILVKDISHTFSVTLEIDLIGQAFYLYFIKKENNSIRNSIKLW